MKIPKAYSSLCSESVLVMEWIDGIRCTDIDQVRRAVNTEEFIRVGVKSGLRQLLEFGLFHGTPSSTSWRNVPQFYTGTRKKSKMRIRRSKW